MNRSTLIRNQIERLAYRSSGSSEFRRALIALLREAFPIAGACCTAVDPRTLLSAGAVTEDGIEAIHSSLFDYEYGREDFNPFEELVRLPDPVSTLFRATGEDLSRSPRYREILRPAGFGDELRAALVSEGSCWGFLILFRSDTQPSFAEEDRAMVSSLVPCLAAAMRRWSLLLPEEAERPESMPGILLLEYGAELREVAANEAAGRWMELLRETEGIDRSVLPRPIRAVSTQALSGKESALARPARACVRLHSGSYVTIRASELAGGASGRLITVWLEPAGPGDMLPLIAAACGLTAREKQLVEAAHRGLSTEEMSATLRISAHTVQDHFKSIFAKTGVSSRRELVWKLFSRFGTPSV
ncbi:helix-turn-helix transcriptional regulator [Cohnella fermenti]|uniref:Helix-turn-helix transcriptional regulator n=1 Tax=Cohnella fermenti TaxID=2565925 RepID=A0A4S4BMI9_9BACL|nr:helix-turn-helix transcriptional regulator [Cohnella fermenti]THF76043.1 helix-turn-helix transcriptional regulator [Cohnella fermenti]